MSLLKLKRAIESKIPIVSHKEFFLSKKYARYLNLLIETTTSRYKNKLKLKSYWLEDMNEFIARTDNVSILINFGHPHLQSLNSLEEKNMALIGLVAHESGHVLFSDFGSISKIQNRFLQGDFYAKSPCTKEIVEYCKTYSKPILHFVKILQNLFEDYYVDMKIKEEYPGLFKKGIEFINSDIFKTLSLEESILSGVKRSIICCNQLLCYMKYDDNCLLDYDGELESRISNCFTIFENLKANDFSSQKLRDTAVELVIFEIWELLKEEMKDFTDEELDNVEKQQNNLLKNNHSITIFDEKTKKDIGTIVDDISKGVVLKEMEKEKLKKANRDVKNRDFGDIHENHSIKIIRDIEPDYDEEIFKKVFSKEISISKKLSASFRKELDKEIPNNKEYGLNKKRFDIKSAYKNEVNFYSRTKSPTKNELAICLLVDESGSMDGSRITQARKSSIIIYQFCKKFGIPISIYGHTDNHNCTSMYSYSEFESIDGDDLYRIQSMSARYNNRDGLALRFCYDLLEKRREKKKLLIIISDGQPSSIGYYYDFAKDDIQKAKLEYQRKGIITFASAIGEDKEKIEEIYKDGFLDMTDLNKLSGNLIKLIKRYFK